MSDIQVTDLDLVPNELREQFEQATIAHYRTVAKTRLGSIINRAKRIDPDEWQRVYRTSTVHQLATQWHVSWYGGYLHRIAGLSNRPRSQPGELKAWAENDPQIEIDYEKVDADARQEVAYNIEFFNARVTEKIDAVIGGRIDDAQIAASLGMEEGVIVGTITVTVDDYSWTFEVQLKTNYRYGDNAADGFMTVYRQVPCITRNETGSIVRTTSKRDLLAEEIRAKREAAKQRKAELKASKRSNLNRIAELMELVKGCQNKERVKEYRAEAKQLREHNKHITTELQEIQ